MNRLKELRKNRGFTQKEVANAIEVSPQSYGYYENEINKPDPDTLIKLSRFFEVSIDYIVGNSDDFGNVTVSPGQLTDQLSVQEKELLDAFNLLGPFERDGILVQVKALAKMNKKEVIK